MTSSSITDSVLAGVATGNAISVGVARKALDVARQEGASAIALIQSAASVAESASGRPGAAPTARGGFGSGFDRYA